MPRPRVQPQNRKRCATACVQCRGSKKKCDSRHPCQKCVAKGEADRCRFPVETTAGICGKATPQTKVNPISQTVARGPPHPEQVRPDVVSTIKQSSILLRSSQDERIFFGNTAAISFLKFLQQTWRTYVEPNDFTEDDGTDKMLEVGHLPSTDPFERELSQQEKIGFVECYLHVSSGILDLFTEKDIERLLGPDEKRQDFGSPASILDPENCRHILLDLMIAIGAQCQTKDGINHRIAITFFQRAQKIAFSEMLQTPTVNLARTFALMSFYMLGACNKNSALMYVGIASNISVILGLHSPENYQHLPVEKREARLQTGKSIRVLDLICNTILGRPGATPVIGNEREYLDGETCPNYGALCAMYEAVAVLQSVVNDTKEKEGLSVDKAEQHLIQLKEWSSRLPVYYRRQKLEKLPSQQSLETRRAVIGKIHLACIYYYGVIQATRQFLVDHIIPSVCGESKEGGGDARTSSLSEMCTEAALFMAQMCEDAENAGALLGNMCILKAWLFSAGLVLGLSLLRQNMEAGDMTQAFQAINKILGRFAISSPQAKQYHGILSNFAEAIDKHKRKSRMNRSCLQSYNVERILSFDEPKNQPSVPFELETGLSSPWATFMDYSDDDITGIMENDDHVFQWNRGDASGDNEIFRMFFDPYLETFTTLPLSNI